VLPAAPSLRGALRASFTDFYFNSGRLVGANVLWGFGLILLYVVALAWPIGAIVLAPFLALPTVGIFRIAALIVRGQPVSFWDGLAAWRRFLGPTLAAGVAGVVAVIIFGSNVVTGLLSNEVVGWAFATFAAWALAVSWVVAFAFWPLLVDPGRAIEPPLRRSRLAGLLVLAHPARFGAFGVVIAAILVASTIAFAALVTISVAYCALVACRYVLLAADQLDARPR
jgi:hypothetical protein